MENTLENKAKFFAQYYTQKVTKSPLLNDNLPSQRCYPELALNPNNGFYLELTSLSQISDEDAIEVAKILDPNEEEGEWSQILEYSKELEDLSNEPSDFMLTPNRVSEYYDYLRSKGYALPYMGLSVEKQIEFGWVKLKKTPNKK